MKIDGYAIICRNDCIADAEGRLPPALMNEADWQYFQAGLDKSDLVIVGRRSHEAAPNARNRPRLILSRAVAGLMRKADGWWWNPDQLPWLDVTDRLSLAGKRLAVPGGQAVFDRFLAIGFTAFHLSRAGNAFLPGGRKIFSGLGAGLGAEELLRARGLVPRPARVLDPANDITLTLFAPRETDSPGEPG